MNVCIRFAAVALIIVISAGYVAAAGKVTTVPVPAGGKAMAAKVDAKGTIHVVFDTQGGPHYVSSSDNGKKWSNPIGLVDRESRKPGLEFITWDMAIGADGSVHVALGNNAWKLKLPKDEWGYFYARLLPGAKTFEPLKNINHRPSEGFSIAVSDTGTVAAVWMAGTLFANISNDGGASFGPTIEIDSLANPCNCCTTSATFAADGRVAILYREETNNDRDIYLAHWDVASGKVTKTRVSATPWKIESCPMTYYTVTRSGDGYVAAWPTKNEVFFTRIKADGTPGKEIKTPGSAGMRSGVIAVPGPDGKTLVAWKKENELGWQVYDELGRPVGSPGSVQSAGSGAAVVVNKSGDFVLFR